MSPRIETLVRTFVAELSAAIEAEALQRIRDRLTQALGTPAPRKPTATKPRTITPARRRTMQLQGQYLAVLRTLPPRDKARVQRTAKTEGVSAALRLAKGLRG